MERKNCRILKYMYKDISDDEMDSAYCIISKIEEDLKGKESK